jgi:hypothetical protein
VELWLEKTSIGTLIGGDAESEAYIARLKIGEMVCGEFKKPRNPLFHRKAMALVRLLYEHFEDRYAGQIRHKGDVVQPNFERFRNDITIVAGYYESTFNINGEVRLTARSWSFAKMDEAEFEKLYSALIQAGLSKVLDKNWDEAKLRNAVEQILQFDRG